MYIFNVFHTLIAKNEIDSPSYTISWALGQGGPGPLPRAQDIYKRIYIYIYIYMCKCLHKIIAKPENRFSKCTPYLGPWARGPGPGPLAQGAQPSIIQYLFFSRPLILYSVAPRGGSKQKIHYVVLCVTMFYSVAFVPPPMS